MSEYQYYEFQALDKPLTKQQQKELRSLSSRAEITATSFVNEYNYGDFRGEQLRKGVLLDMVVKRSRDRIDGGEFARAEEHS